MKKIYILLPVFNRQKTIGRFINCLVAQTYQNYHLILINDGSTDDTEDIVTKRIKKLTVIKGNGNWWWAGSLQEGYKWLKKIKILSSDIVLIINDDLVFKSDFLERAIAILADKKNVLLQAVCYSLQTKKLVDKGAFMDWKNFSYMINCEPEQINCLCTKGLFLRAEDFFKIGGFHRWLLPHYTSDLEFTIRAYNKGMSLITDHSLKLWSDDTITGYHSFKGLSILEFIKRYFSMKSAMNPIHWTVFIILACPWRWKILNIYRCWKNFLGNLLKNLKIDK